MPVTGKVVFNQDKRASWFSHKAEVAKPNYYRVYLADHDVVTEITPTERAAMFRFTFPESDNSYVIVDAFDRGSYVKIIPEENKIIGYTTRNSGGVPQNFRNYFVVVFDKPFTYQATVGDDEIRKGETEAKENHTGAIVGFSTRKGEIVHARVASSFISPEQAELNLKELGDRSWTNYAHSIPACTVRYFSRAVSTNLMQTEKLYITVRITEKCCRGICLPIPVFGIRSVACSPS